MKEYIINIIKIMFFNIIGILILFKSGWYICEHNDISFLVGVSLVILTSIGIYFIKVDFLKRTDKDIAEAGIALFIYTIKRIEGEIEEDENAENLLNDSPLGEAVKEFIDVTELNESKEKE